MKNKKIFTVLFLLAVSALLFTSCTFKMNTAQKAHYEKFINALENELKTRHIPAGAVIDMLAEINTEALALDYQIVDKKPGTSIAQGTKAAALRKRFIPKKIK
ncbi:hypothetical protein HMPREF9727_00322 [Treponema denticola MYR-T]|uniref:Factor H binding protein B domain-containing protein n=4 Tax=Treponema denticola TaxID=158 RepID=Q73RI0_TREDE|nr:MULTISPECIES: hypothetical protein [Treponema]AAS10606.1 hypothetical protein TDE_0108 [Treponema denticola ATCC 35405]ADT80557.1 factor H binding protein [Treponema denticola]ADT80559.1 factor H binding protein [Treponema denticola]ADT80565.1 factor H binding protein [Treponema denticola]EMB32249.1 hypothetical protein HMPREF9727_00322 [Treponema denticola MYR-T]